MSWLCAVTCVEMAKNLAHIWFHSLAYSLAILVNYSVISSLRMFWTCYSNTHTHTHTRLFIHAIESLTLQPRSAFYMLHISFSAHENAKAVPNWMCVLFSTVFDIFCDAFSLRNFSFHLIHSIDFIRSLLLINTRLIISLQMLLLLIAVILASVTANTVVVVVVW